MPVIGELIESETLKMVMQAPTYSTEMFIRLSDSCTREPCNAKPDLSVPYCKSAFGQKCFSYKGPKRVNFP